MHSGLLLLTLGVALIWRWRSHRFLETLPYGPWQSRWTATLQAFCLPPLMLLVAAMAVLTMGHHGTMMGWGVSPIGCWLGLATVAWGATVGGEAAGRALYSQWRWRQCALVDLPGGGQARCLATPLPVVAQVGLWQSSLVVSQGWLDQLTLPEQQATLAHEQAHADYRDPLWFLILGMVRRFSLWLPHTQSLWEDLLLLREIRADQQAARHSDPLLLAELLVKLSRQVSLAGQGATPPSWASFNPASSPQRLQVRVIALISPIPESPSVTPGLTAMGWLVIAALRLATIGLHS
ncbi:MAG: M56 family metallopeptidase [Cyanobacteriota bacterium]|nr:M56 family metallopeptidase [Cyanobacteriota bacterium]